MQFDQLTPKLENLGLTDKEAKVYMANLFLGPSPVQKIAEQAGINRATTYVILDQLTTLGLVSQSTERKKTAYVADPPESLGRLFDQQQQAIQSKQKAFAELLPELKKIGRGGQRTAPSVRFYKGPEGIKAINAYLRRQSNTKAVIYGLSDVDEILKVFPDMLKENPNYRLKKKLASKVIYSWVKGRLPSSQKVLRQTKRSPGPVKADVTLYEKGATLIAYGGKESIGIIIESPEIVGALRQLFEMAWDNPKLK